MLARTSTPMVPFLAMTRPMTNSGVAVPDAACASNFARTPTPQTALELVMWTRSPWVVAADLTFSSGFAMASTLRRRMEYMEVWERWMRRWASGGGGVAPACTLQEVSVTTVRPRPPLALVVQGACTSGDTLRPVTTHHWLALIVTLALMFVDVIMLWTSLMDGPLPSHFIRQAVPPVPLVTPCQTPPPAGKEVRCQGGAASLAFAVVAIFVEYIVIGTTTPNWMRRAAARGLGSG